MCSYKEENKDQRDLASLSADSGQHIGFFMLIVFPEFLH